MADQKKGSQIAVPPKLREFKAWIKKKHPGVNYWTVRRSMRRTIFNKWKEYLKQLEYPEFERDEVEIETVDEEEEFEDIEIEDVEEEEILEDN